MKSLHALPYPACSPYVYCTGMQQYYARMQCIWHAAQASHSCALSITFEKGEAPSVALQPFILHAVVVLLLAPEHAPVALEVAAPMEGLRVRGGLRKPRGNAAM